MESALFGKGVDESDHTTHRVYRIREVTKNEACIIRYPQYCSRWEASVCLGLNMLTSRAQRALVAQLWLARNEANVLITKDGHPGHPGHPGDDSDYYSAKISVDDGVVARHFELTYSDNVIILYHGTADLAVDDY